jgi:hypothetical protein
VIATLLIDNGNRPLNYVNTAEMCLWQNICRKYIVSGCEFIGKPRGSTESVITDFTLKNSTL